MGGDWKAAWLQGVRTTEVLSEALEIEEPVGLALRREISQRQAARDREDAAEVDRQDVDRRAGLGGDRGEASFVVARGQRGTILPFALESVSLEDVFRQLTGRPGGEA